MLNLTTAIYGKLSGSDLADHIGTKLYKGRAPEDAVYPYIVFIIISQYPEKTYSEDFEVTHIQFSLFSSTSSSTEVENMYTDLKTLYDECAMTVTSSTWFYWMKRLNATLMVEDHTTRSGLIQAWHYAVDYEIMTLDS